MGRSNIFDKLNKSLNIEDDIHRINELVFERDTLERGSVSMTIKDAVEDYCFHLWPKRGHFIDLDDFLEALDYNELLSNAECNFDAQLDFLELCYNLYMLVERDCMDDHPRFALYNEFDLVKTIMDSTLEKLNYEAFFNKNDASVILLEKNAAVTSVVETEEDIETAIDIIQYNHHALKGDIKKKKVILIRLGNELEACKKQLTNINNSLATDIFMMFNNLDLRHNNVKEGSKNYQKAVADMSPDELESWYDELYQMVLLAKLELDNIERAKKVAALKETLAK